MGADRVKIDSSTIVLGIPFAPKSHREIIPRQTPQTPHSPTLQEANNFAERNRQ